MKIKNFKITLFYVNFFFYKLKLEFYIIKRKKKGFRMGILFGKTNLKSEKKELSENDAKMLTSLTRLKENEIKHLFELLNKENPDGYLSKEEFKKLYTQLRPEKYDHVEKICEHVYRAFDLNTDGKVSVNEFLVIIFNVIINFEEILLYRYYSILKS